MFAYDYPLGGVFLSTLYFFLFFIWIWILITVFIDIFASHDLNGWIKALWCIFVIILPFLGVFIYLIARGGKMQERKLQAAAQQKSSFDSYVRETAGTSSANVAAQLSELANLKSQGVLTDAEFETQKAKVLAAS
jgi:ABC-type multidrug transport system fused ATPase/permease subunit